MKSTRRANRWIGPTLLLATPTLLTGMARALQWIDAATVRSALTGIAIAAIGGAATGLVAERFLHRGRNEVENMAGLIGVTMLGLLTIGYLYLIHIRGPMATIGLLPRAVQQVLGFAEYLTAQGAILLAVSNGQDKPLVSSRR